jgi:hypothetical protein
MSDENSMLTMARRCSEKELPDGCEDWWSFDEAVYKAQCDMELMQKLSGKQKQNADLDLLDFMNLGIEKRNILRLSILKLQRAKRFIRKSQNPYQNILSDVLYDAVINRGVNAAKSIGHLLKS